MIHTRYDDLTNPDDEESEVVKALAELTSNVPLQNAKSQSQRKRTLGKIDMAHIMSAAQPMIDGNI